MTEERCVRAARSLAQCGPMRSRDERGIGLVEADMPVGPEPQDQQIDAAGARDGAFVACAHSGQIARGAVEEMDAPARQVDVIEEVALHERAVAARVCCGYAEELVEIERRRSGEVD